MDEIASRQFEGLTVICDTPTLKGRTKRARLAALCGPTPRRKPPAQIRYLSSGSEVKAKRALG